jgi:hypothetical protein
MELLLDNNAQIIRKLSRISESTGRYSEEYDRLDPDIDYDAQPLDSEKYRPDQVMKVLVDQLKNTIEILRFLAKTDVTADELSAAREECVGRVESAFQGSKNPVVDYFIRVYTDLLNNKYSKIDLRM